MALQYGGHDDFHSEVPFGGHYIPFETDLMFWEKSNYLI